MPKTMLTLAEGIPRRLPDFLIIGAAKSGTTSLYHYLGQHPTLYFPPQFKEPGYLCFANALRPRLDTGLPDMWQATVTDLESYSSLFESAPRDSLLGEATPEYLLLADRAVQNIERIYANHASQLKFLTILRNPVDRIWSHYWMMLRDGYENLSFADAISPQTISNRLAAGWHPAYDYLGYGMYHQQLKTYIDHFGADRVRIVLFEDFREDASRVCTSFFEFLGVDSAFSPEVSVQHNYSGALRIPWLHEWLFTRDRFLKRVARRLMAHARLQRLKARIVRWNSQKKSMPQEMRAHLRNVYRDDILALSQLIGRNLEHWLV